MISIPSAANAGQSFTPSSNDNFDAIVQAANPSHPNHAAWVEKFGGSVPRRTLARSASGDDEEKDVDVNRRRSGSIKQRRSRANTYGSKRSEIADQRKQEEPTAIETYMGRMRSRTHTSASESRPPYHLQDEDLPQPETRRSIDELNRKKRKKKKRKDDEKGRERAPPVPPPRTTSHGLQTAPLEPLMSSLTSNASPSTTTSFLDPLVTPKTPATSTFFGSNHSRNTSASHHTPTSPHDNPQSPVRTMSNKHTTSSSSSFRGYPSSSTADAPTRLSSMHPRDGSIDQGRSLATQTATKTGHPFHRNFGNGSRPSVDFAVLEEISPRRESVDSNAIRRSFDALVSPFRSVRENSFIVRKGMGPLTTSAISPSPPILLTPSIDMPIIPASQARPLSSVRDEGEGVDSSFKGGNWGLPVPSSPLLPELYDGTPSLQPIAASVVPVTDYSRSGNITEEAEDFFDAQSDEGGNGSSAEEASQIVQSLPLSGAQSTAEKKKGKKKSVDYHNTARARAKVAASGLGVVALDLLPSSTIVIGQASTDSTEKLDSSASEAEQERKGITKFPRGEDRTVVTEKALVREEIVSSKRQKPVQDTPVEMPIHSSMQEDSSADVKVAGSIEYVTTPRKLTPDEEWNERFDASTFHPSPSVVLRSEGHQNRSGATRSTPLPSAPLFSASHTSLPDKAVNSSVSGKAPSGRSNRGFAGVMARMKRDRTPSTNTMNTQSFGLTLIPNSPEQGLHLEQEYQANSIPFGLGIGASDVIDGEKEEVRMKSWRHRLASLSSKSAKAQSREGQEEKHQGVLPPPLPPVSVKGRKSFVIADYANIRRDWREDPTPPSSIPMREGVAIHSANSGENSMTSDRFNEPESPTIHKSLSPAFLLEHHHQVDKDADKEKEQSTRSFLPHSHPLPAQTVVVGSSPTASTREAPLHAPVTTRKHSNSIGLPANWNLGGKSRRKPSPALDSPPPLPPPSKPSTENVEVNTPTPARRSIDIRMPSFSSIRSRTFNNATSSVDRSSPMVSQTSSPTPLTDAKISPKSAKRLFQSSGNKGKEKWKGISSSDFVPSYVVYDEGTPVNGSQSDLQSLNVSDNYASFYTSQRSHVDDLMKGNIDKLEEMDDSVFKTQEATNLLAVHMDNMALTPSSPNSLNNQSLRPLPRSRSATFASTTTTSTTNPNSDASAFSMMLRNSAREDAARLKEIAHRTAQAHGAASRPC
ncbi:hypothetical protein CBS101457_004401 [Exobasidium rhododendri]|nr:hypothetical protein CBS101457_004401 [Exobasidium rhododendri]